MNELNFLNKKPRKSQEKVAAAPLRTEQAHEKNRHSRKLILKGQLRRMLKQRNLQQLVSTVEYRKRLEEQLKIK